MNAEIMSVSGGNIWYDYNNFLEDIIIKYSCNKDSISIDVGCHTGRFTQLMSNLSKFVYAFDPSSILLEQPHSVGTPWFEKKNNGNIIFINCALSDSRSVLNYIEYDKSSWNSLLPETASRLIPLKKISERNVPVLVLDDLVHDSNVGLLKIDAEGFDIKVLFGSKNLITKNKPVIIIEATSEKLRHQIIEFLKPYKYNTFNVGWKLDATVPIADPKTNSLNLLCVHQDQGDLLDVIIQNHNAMVNLYENMTAYDVNVPVKWLTEQFAQKN